MKTKTYGFVDAANLFYGGEKSLGWKIDYKKLFNYLKKKYGASKIFYYAGVEIYRFHYSVIDGKTLDLDRLLLYLQRKLTNKKTTEKEIQLLEKNIKQVKFYRKLKEFGFTLKLKPTKVYWNEGRSVKKANCDVDMTLDMVRYMEQYSTALMLSGDGDFAAVIQYLKSKKRNICILARGERSAKEIRQLAGKNFRDFNYLREQIKYIEK